MAPCSNGELMVHVNANYELRSCEAVSQVDVGNNLRERTQERVQIIAETNTHYHLEISLRGWSLLTDASTLSRYGN
jgi:hypothetical protein